MSYWYFFSYARADLDEYLKKFQEDLQDEISKIRTTHQLGVQRFGYGDLQNTQTGDLWEPVLEEALGTSRFLLSLCAPNYFNSPYCGKEFAVFLHWHRRLATSAGPANAPRLIIPVIWGEPSGSVNEIITPFQYFTAAFPEIYAKEGLRYMMKLSKHRDEYEVFVRELARSLVEVGEARPLSLQLSPLTTLMSLREITSAFHAPPPADSMLRRNSGKNSRFVFVAAPPDEHDVTETPVERYGEEGGRYWMPYFPTEEESVGNLALEVVSTLKLYYGELAAAQDLVDSLRAARSREELVVVVVDPWTLRLPAYRQAMQDYDERNFLNCTLVVPWHEDDYNDPQRRNMLTELLEMAFPSKIELNLPLVYFRNPVLSLEHLKSHMITALSHIRMKWLGKRIAEGNPQKFDGEEIIRQASERGISVGEAKPEIASPGGAQR